MKMYSRIFDDMRNLNAYVNETGIPKENIVNILTSPDGSYLLVYYAEE